jgi:hypothetical protein
LPQPAFEPNQAASWWLLEWVSDGVHKPSK